MKSQTERAARQAFKWIVGLWLWGAIALGGWSLVTDFTQGEFLGGVPGHL